MVQTRRSKQAAQLHVSAAYCWCAYITALVAITAAALVLEPPPSLQGRPLLRGLIADVAATCIVYAFSLFADNSSIYDPYWCVLPLWLMAYWRHEASSDSARGLLVMNLIWAWAIRFFVGYPWDGWTTGLTHEDWRYADLRIKLGKCYWPFSLSSLHLTPTLLVFGALAPAGAVVVQENAPPLNYGDLVACATTVAFLVLEAFSDETLWRHRARGAKTTCVAGPWAWSRHPNYVGECGFWSGIYLFAWAAGVREPLYAVGPVALWLFFRFASAPLMEARSCARRPDYDAVSPSAVLVPVPFLSRKASSGSGKKRKKKHDNFGGLNPRKDWNRKQILAGVNGPGAG